MAKRILCPRCNGRGYRVELVQHPDAVRGHLFRERIWMKKTCWRCNGKGVIKEPNWAEKMSERLLPSLWD
jgi:DnaJ-class molecular chaperone